MTSYATPVHLPQYAPQYRLTRRGRLAVFVVALVAAVLAGIWLSTVSAATPEAEQTETIVVASGDTLWDLASERAESGDVLEMIGHIKALNDLEGGSLSTGQQLLVPAG